jgi:arylsulfatase A-like enzyme
MFGVQATARKTIVAVIAALAGVLWLGGVGCRCRAPSARPTFPTLFHAVSSNGADGTIAPITINNEVREALAATPGAVVAWPFARLRAGCSLSFGHGIYSADMGNLMPIHFTVYLRDISGKLSLLYSKSTGDDRRWIDREVSLSPFVGKSGTLIFRITCDADPAGPGQPAGVIPVWSNARIVAPADGSPADRPSFLWITVDTLRADHLGCYGCARPTTPFIDSLAAQGVVYEAAFSQAPWTQPSVQSMMSSQYPRPAEAKYNPNEGLNRFLDIRHSHLLPMEFENAGYTVAAFTNIESVYAPFSYSKLGFSRSFQNSTGTENFRDWLGANGGKPFFAYVHLFGAHAPYSFVPGISTQFIDQETAKATENATENLSSGFLRKQQPGPEVTANLVRLYDGRILLNDQVVKYLVETLAAHGALDRTFIVITADHGEEFWEHGHWEHGHSYYDELLHVPLILVPPGKNPGKRIAGMTSLLNVAPTLLNYAGLPVPDDYRGRPLQFREEDDADPVIYAENMLYGQVAEGGADRPRDFGLRTNDLKYANLGNAIQVFDLKADPGERNNLAAVPEWKEKAEKALQEFLQTDYETVAQRQANFLFQSSSPKKWTLKFASDRDVIPIFPDDGFDNAPAITAAKGRTECNFTTDKGKPLVVKVILYKGLKLLSAQIRAQGKPLPAGQLVLPGGQAAVSPAALLKNLAAPEAFRTLRGAPPVPAATDNVTIWIDSSVKRIPTAPKASDEETRRKILRSLGYL